MNQEKREEVLRYSHIGIHSSSNLVYAMQYKEAFDSLYESDKPVDTIALPMMFLMRYYLELILKYNIMYFSEFSDSNFLTASLSSVHSLEKLAGGFKQHWDSVVKKYNLTENGSEYFSNFQDLIDLVHHLDGFSMSFRYSHDKNGDKNFDHTKTLNIKEIKGLLEKVVPLLDYSIDVFYYEIGQYIEMEEEMLKEIENEMMAEYYRDYR